MSTTTLVILAFIMAVFGVLGSQRGMRSALLLTAAVIGGLLAIRFGSATIIGFVNKMGRGVQLLLASEGAPKAGDLASADQPGGWLVIFFIVLVGGALLLGQLKQLLGGGSFLGLLLGLASGYLAGAYLLNSLGLSEVALPLLFGLSAGGKVLEGFAAIPRAEKDLAGALSGFVGDINKGTLALLLTIALALFFILVLRPSGKGAPSGKSAHKG